MKYINGLVIGRFQVLHNGHKKIIDTALELCDKVVVIIGSSQESRTYKNPLNYEERYDMLSSIYKTEIESGRVMLLPLEDNGSGNTKEWGDYVIENIPAEFCPNLFVSGKENRRYNWFENHEIDELFISKVDNICATDVRQAMIENNLPEWQRRVPKELYNKYEYMRKIVMNSMENKYTESV